MSTIKSKCLLQAKFKIEIYFTLLPTRMSIKMGHLCYLIKLLR